MTPLRSIVCLSPLDMTVTQDSCVRARPNMLHMLFGAGQPCSMPRTPTPACCSTSPRSAAMLPAHYYKSSPD